MRNYKIRNAPTPNKYTFKVSTNHLKQNEEKKWIHKPRMNQMPADWFKVSLDLAKRNAFQLNRESKKWNYWKPLTFLKSIFDALKLKRWNDRLYEVYCWSVYLFKFDQMM